MRDVTLVTVMGSGAKVSDKLSVHIAARVICVRNPHICAGFDWMYDRLENCRRASSSRLSNNLLVPRPQISRPLMMRRMMRRHETSWLAAQAIYMPQRNRLNRPR
jgi:hypothetical protein